MTKKVKKVEVPEVLPEVVATPEEVVAPPEKKKRVRKPKVVAEVKPVESEITEVAFEETPEIKPESKVEEESIPEKPEVDVVPELTPQQKEIKNILDKIKKISEDKLPENLREKHRRVIAKIEEKYKIK